MREFSVEDGLKKSLIKISKKDPALHEATMRKIDEILNCPNLDHYKNLRSPLQEYKRVHVKGPFVLTVKYIEKEDKVLFYDLDHYDFIYRN